MAVQLLVRKPDIFNYSSTMTRCYLYLCSTLLFNAEIPVYHETKEKRASSIDTDRSVYLTIYHSTKLNKTTNLQATKKWLAKQ